MFCDSSIAGDWTQLTRRLDAVGALSRWSRTEPALRGLGRIDELAALLAPGSGTDPDRADALLGALVRTACRDGGDDTDAVLLVLHLLADGLRPIAARLADLSEEILALLVGELTVQIRTFPLRRTRAYAANLLRDTQRACWRELRPHRTRTYRAGTDILVDPLDHARMCHWFDRPIGGPGGEDGTELGDVLAWAEQCGIASRRDLALLVDLERQRGYGTAARHRVAASFGINERTLRRHRDRALAALRAAAQDYLNNPDQTPGASDAHQQDRRGAVA
jgi:hypothetical protein